MQTNSEGYPQSQEISKYNDATFSIIRLHEMWNDCKMHIKHGNLVAWKFELDNVWLELYNDVMRRNNKYELVKDNIRLMETISNSKNRNALFQSLLRRHEFLRQMQDISGKGGVYHDEDDELGDA